MDNFINSAIVIVMGTTAPSPSFLNSSTSIPFLLLQSLHFSYLLFFSLLFAIQVHTTKESIVSAQKRDQQLLSIKRISECAHIINKQGLEVFDFPITTFSRLILDYSEM